MTQTAVVEEAEVAVTVAHDVEVTDTAVLLEGETSSFRILSQYALILSQ